MSKPIQHRLAVVTGAVSAAAAPLAADAGIVYTDATNAFTVSFSGPTSAEWDVDGAGGNDFKLWTFQYPPSYIWFSSAGGRNGGGFVGSATNNRNFYNMAAGNLVGPTLTGAYAWGPGNVSTRSVLANSVSNSVGPNFKNGIRGSNFVGFRFASGADTLYGWAEVIIGTGQVTINRWAYNDAKDGSIEVGQTEGAPVPAPAPSTLALLAAGAFGVRRWRRQRAAA